MLLQFFIVIILSFGYIKCDYYNDVLNYTFKAREKNFNETTYQFIRKDMEYVVYSITHTYGTVFTHKDFDKYGVLPTVLHSPIKVVIHGMFVNETIMEDFIGNLVRYNNAVVINVDWTNVNHTLLNELQRIGPMYIANCVFEMLLSFLSDEIGSYDVHLIGHGLGAHIAGYVGRIAQIHNFTLNRITGLDAINPYMKNGLRKKDAIFVDLINTSKVKLPAKYFENGNRGDADFYVNPEETQLLCIKHPNHKECNSLQSYVYFSDSIKHPHKYRGVRCMLKVVSMYCCKGTGAIMGINVNFGTTGVFYVNSNRTKENTYPLHYNNKLPTYVCE